MLTIHLLTKNNQQTIQATLESISSLNCKIIAGDLGSTDNTIMICKKMNVETLDLKTLPRNKARNILCEKSKNSLNFWIEPWEILMQGMSVFNKFSANAGYTAILQNKTITHEIRLWKGNAKFINPVFETLDIEYAENTPLLLASNGKIDYDDYLNQINLWKTTEPFIAKPYYYQACILLAQSKYKEFINTAETYLFMDKTNSMPATMIRYYYALAQLVYNKEFKSALKSINLCLCEKPLMAEFWCLMADIYYHLLHKFNEAKEFYENAIILGGKRLKDDKWPMDISKYKSYPTKMIESCQSLINHKSALVQTNL